MATSKEHYEQVLSAVYSWMHGGFEASIQRNREFFQRHQVSPGRSKIAMDLGAGCGFQSIPLAQMGYSVTAIDIDARLLKELKDHSGTLPIVSIQDNLTRLREHTTGGVELVVCMTDTLLHLESREDVVQLFENVHSVLELQGRFILTFRDLTYELSELDRFIPVRSDDKMIFTCFLEYEADTVKVHDLVYRKEAGQWDFQKSYYRKLRLSAEWVLRQLANAGFANVHSDIDKGLATVVATRTG